MKNVIGYIAAVPLFLWGSFVQPVYAQTFSPTFCDAGQNKVPTQLKTAIGCIDTSPTGFAQKLLTLSIGIAGGIAFLMIILGALQVQTAAGNPEKMNQGREIIEGAIIGLLIIVLAIFILKIVGVNILSIPGFS